MASLTDHAEVDKYGFDLTLSLYGYNEFKKNLAEFDAKLRRAMDREIRDVLEPIKQSAIKYVPDQPLSNWKFGSERYMPSKLPFWDASAVRKGISVKQGGRRRKGSAEQAAWRIANSSPAGAAFELAGRVTKDNRLAVSLGKHPEYAKPRRLVWRAWHEHKAYRTAPVRIREIVVRYEAELNSARAASGS